MSLSNIDLLFMEKSNIYEVKNNLTTQLSSKIDIHSLENEMKQFQTTISYKEMVRGASIENMLYALDRLNKMFTEYHKSKNNYTEVRQSKSISYKIDVYNSEIDVSSQLDNKERSAGDKPLFQKRAGGERLKKLTKGLHRRNITSGDNKNLDFQSLENTYYTTKKLSI